LLIRIILKCPDQLTPLTLMHINMQSLMGRADPRTIATSIPGAQWFRDQLLFCAGGGITFLGFNPIQIWIATWTIVGQFPQLQHWSQIHCTWRRSSRGV